MHDTSSATGFLGGHIDLMLLKVISVGDCYGYSIYKILSGITGHMYEIKEATLYSGLRRLEADQLITAYWGDETQGGRRKYYAITEKGQECLSENINKWQKTKFILESILNWKGEDEA